MNKKLIIGISGVATSGKDTCCKLLIESLYEKFGITASRIALADQLKVEIRDELISKFGIDVLNCTPQEKETIRPSLVAYGKLLRESSEGTHWTSVVQKKLESMTETVIIVPDIRYNHYLNDEVKWIHQNNGLLLHVARYSRGENGEKLWVMPPNEDERIHDPLVRADADFSLSWETLDFAALKSQYGGFFDTIASVASYEYANLNR